MTSCTTRIKMATEAFPCSSSGDARQHPINSRSFDIITNDTRTTGARVAVSNTILIGISAAIGFATVAGSDVALLLLLYLDRPIPISHLLAWELMFMGTWILATWIIYRLLVFVKFAPFRGAKHNERHQC
ncbi:hypothetical protein CH063_09797 [Colletotrichum higginsianum]|uniref:Uncharacterized protein n=2 Tax=Colletotrichum higginsianum TaxID=80884 RepID=H1VEZ6_COLHI|nr:hypothetical protein CH63R_01324 [Colletotrichum higginsianum IMI 349063]OBR16144.1 hypothetical protein CH63R_01324 [Colletotrichum higginsianum IMI 349063]TID04495.1 hypothetical protein CH35J_002137 [Colletotrichum higginsianum]CCF38799.1 hypothetical protein CH063_09797 [Colletotrichum higginsianum]